MKHPASCDLSRVDSYTQHLLFAVSSDPTVVTTKDFKMAPMRWLFSVAIVTMTAFQCLAQNGQTSPKPCSMGENCRHTFSRSFINNMVFCCPNGAGMSVNSVNNIVYCQCGNGGGTFISNTGNSFFVNGQQVNASEVQPMLDNMRQNMRQNMQRWRTNFQQWQRNFQAQMAAQRAALNQQMRNLGHRLRNMFNRW